MNSKKIILYTIELLLISIVLVNCNLTRKEKSYVIEGTFDENDKKSEDPINKFKPIPVDKENGFYAVVSYKKEAENKDVKLEERPSITLREILEVKKVYSEFNSFPEISIELNEYGTQRLYSLTRDNLGKPIAIVVDSQIISMPVIQTEIVKGKVSISGVFSEIEVDKIIENLKRNI